MNNSNRVKIIKTNHQNKSYVQILQRVSLLYEQKNLKFQNMKYNLFFQGIIYDIIKVNESLRAFRIIFFSSNTYIRLVMLNSDKVKIRKMYQVRGENENMEVLSPFGHKLLSQRNMTIKMCSRMKTWHKTKQSYIILFKDRGGVGREGGITKWEGAVLARRRKKRLSVK